MIIRPSILGRLAGVSRQRISALLAGPWSDARRPGGGVDMGHPRVTEWLRSRGLDPEQVARAAGGASARAPSARAPRRAEARGAGARGAAAGGASAPAPPAEAQGPSLDILTARRVSKIEKEIERLEISNAVARGRLIDRDLVRVYVISYADGLQRRLLQDLPRSLPPRLQSTLPAAEVVTILRDAISSQIRDLKKEITQKLRRVTRASAATAEPADAEAAAGAE